MEHRWGQRFSVAIDASLHIRPRSGPRRGRIVDISASGAFIRTNIPGAAPQIPLPLLSPVQVEIPVPTGNGHALLRLPACIVRRTKDGIGVEWCGAESLVVADLVAEYGVLAGAQSIRVISRPLAPGSIPAALPSSVST